MTHAFPRVQKPMRRMVEENQRGVFKRALKVNSVNNTNLGLDSPGGNAPTGLGVHKLNGTSKIMLNPYGAILGSFTSDSFRLAVTYWYPIFDNTSTRESNEIGWMPTTAALLDCKLSPNLRGTAGPLTTDDEFCNINIQTPGTSSGFVHKDFDDFVPTDGAVPDPIPGSSVIILNTKGASYIQFQFDRNGTHDEASAESCNCLFMEI